MKEWWKFISIQLILDIATLLGGISALIFFWDRFVPKIAQVYKRRLYKGFPIDKLKSLSILHPKKIGAIFGLLSGVIIPIIALLYPLYEIAIFLPLGFIMLFIGDLLGKRKSVKFPAWIYSHLAGALQSVGLFIFLWSFGVWLSLFGLYECIKLFCTLVAYIFFRINLPDDILSIFYFITLPITLIVGAWLGAEYGSEVDD